MRSELSARSEQSTREAAQSGDRSGSVRRFAHCGLGGLRWWRTQLDLVIGDSVPLTGGLATVGPAGGS